MAIGTLIGGAIGAVGSIIGGSNNSKAINKATDATVQANAQNLAMQKEIYGENKQTLAPFVNAGTQATGAINALLGLTPTNQPQQAAPQAPANTGQFQYNPSDYGGGLDGIRGGLAAVLQRMQQRQNGPTTAGMPTPGAIQQSTYLTPQQAFQNYQNSTGYQFRLNQGMNALNSGYAGAGLIKSGAAMKAAQDYGQNIASQEFNNYMNLLAGQQGTGLTAAGAQAGVATNYANTAGAINSNTANALGQAAIAKANNSNALLGGLAGAAGTILGGVKW